MSGVTAEVRRERTDWVALEMHQWQLTRGKRGILAWVFTAVALLLATVHLLGGWLWGAVWVYETLHGREPPVDAATTAVIVLGMSVYAALFAYPVTPHARRWWARRRAITAGGRQIRRGERPTEEVLRVTLDAGGWGEETVPPRHWPWPAVKRLDMTATHLFIALADGGWLVVPAASFADARAFHDFAAHAIDFTATSRTASGQ